MIDITARFGSAIALGFAVAAPVGPTGITAIRLGLKRGANTAFWIGMGAAATDFVYVLLTYAGLGPLLHYVPWLSFLLYVVGAFVIGKMALASLNDSFKRRRDRVSGVTVTSQQGTDASLRAGWWSAFVLGLSITVVNPATITSWLTLGGAFVAANLISVPVPVAPAILLGILVGSAGWFTILACLVWLARTAATRLPIVLDVVGIGSGLVLLGFAAGFLYQAVRFVHS